METREIEVKMKLSNPEITLTRLAEAGCKLSQPIIQDDRVFLANGVEYGNLPQRTIFLRIRVQNDRTIFTLKQQQTNELDCIERELGITNADAMADILTRLGYREVLRIKKERRKGNYMGYEVCVDNVDGLGWFIEVEKISSEDAQIIQEEITNFLVGLGLDRNDRVLKGYDTLLLNLSKRG